MHTLRISFMFIRTNFKKALSSILTLITFLLVLNILLGVLFSTTGILGDTITENESVHYMEIINEGDSSNIQIIYQDLNSMDKVKGCFIDVSHPIVLPCNSEEGMKIYTLVGLPKELLSEIGVSSQNDKYLFLPIEDQASFDGIDVVQIEESLYVQQADESWLPEIVCYDYEITGFIEKIQWDIFPENIAIIDDKTAMEIAKGMTMNGDNYLSDRVIVYVSDVSNMKAVQEHLERTYSNVDIRYALKYTGQLPEYATVLIAVSGIIIAILLVFCYINIKNNVKQLLSMRQRDIALLSMFGVENKKITGLLVTEFSFYGVVAFLFVSAITFVLFFALRYVFSIDLLSGYMTIYLISNAVIALLILTLVSSFQVRSLLGKIDHTKIYKSILK